MHGSPHQFTIQLCDRDKTDTHARTFLPQGEAHRAALPRRITCSLLSLLTDWLALVLCDESSGPVSSLRSMHISLASIWRVSYTSTRTYVDRRSMCASYRQLQSRSSSSVVSSISTCARHQTRSHMTIALLTHTWWSCYRWQCMEISLHCAHASTSTYTDDSRLLMHVRSAADRLN